VPELATRLRTALAPATTEVRSRLTERDRICATKTITSGGAHHRRRTEAKGRARLVCRLKALRLLMQRYAGHAEPAVPDQAPREDLPWAIPSSGQRRQWPCLSRGGREIIPAGHLHAKCGLQLSLQHPEPRQAPFLFLIYIEPLLRWVRSSGHGYRWGCLRGKDANTQAGCALSALAFADDINLFSDTVEGIEAMAAMVEAFSRWSNLGVKVTMTLDWKPQIEEMTARLRTKLGQLEAAKITPRQVMHTLEADAGRAHRYAERGRA